MWNCTHFRHPTDEQLQHSYIFSNYYNLQSVHFEYRNNGKTVLYSLSKMSGFLYVSRKLKALQCCENGPKVYSPYPKRLESLTICRCNYKGSPFSLVILEPEWFSSRSRTYNFSHAGPTLNQLSHLPAVRVVQHSLSRSSTGCYNKQCLA